MDSTILVDGKYEEGKKLIELLDRSGNKYPIALWMFNDERNDWELLFGVPKLRIIGAKETYNILYKAIYENNIKLSLNNITLRDTSDEMLQALRMMIKTGNTISKIEFFGNFINGKTFPDAIIYRVN